MQLSIIIPIFNEMRFLESFTRNLDYSFKNENVEYIFVNDGSYDGTEEWLPKYIKEKNNKNFYYIDIKKNRGKGYALKEGLKIAKGNYILFQDADLELDTKDSLEMYKIIKNNNNIKVLFGTRYKSGKLKKNKNLINEFVGKINSFIFNIFFGQSISDLHCGTKIISKDVIEKLKLKVNDFGIEIDIASQIVKNNFQIYEYGVSYIARGYQEGKKITWIDGLKSYYYLTKIRFVDNDLSILLSIIFSSFYMSFIGSYFGLGTGKMLLVFLFFIIGCFIGLNRKLTTSSIVFLSCYLGSLLSKGNGKIYTVIVLFLFGLYFSKKISKFIHKHSSNKLIRFLV